MSEKVIVAVDGGTASTAALDWVIERARAVDLTLEITTVADLDWVPNGEVERFMPEYDRVVLDASRRVDASGVAVRYSTTVHRGRALEGLLSASRRADLLVIGTHKTSAAVGIINGTLPLSIAARTGCPLVVVPVGWVPAPGPIVAGVDADTGETALLFAAREAERTGRNLVAVRAWDLPRRWPAP
jgi:nucleotide-binding universal stress UspA family protein